MVIGMAWISAQIKRLLIGVGGQILDFFESMADFLILMLQTVVAMFRKGWSVATLFEQFFHLIVKSLPLVSIAAFSTGAVLALQFGQGMTRFGGKLYVPTVVALSVVKALGPVLSSLMIASRVGSGTAAEIGGMQISQQIDAIRALGTDPIQKLVVPRVLALALGMPLLTLLANLMGILGGLLVGAGELGISTDLYIQKTADAIAISDMVIGAGKATFFAILIGFIGCFQGLRTKSGTVGIGTSTTNAVVVGCLVVMLSDVLITKLIWILQW